VMVSRQISHSRGSLRMKKSSMASVKRAKVCGAVLLAHQRPLDSLDPTEESGGVLR
jgi:hypothetical protein